MRPRPRGLTARGPRGTVRPRGCVMSLRRCAVGLFVLGCSATERAPATSSSAPRVEAERALVASDPAHAWRDAAGRPELGVGPIATFDEAGATIDVGGL